MHDQHTKTNINERIVAIEDDHKRKVVRRGLGKSTEDGDGTYNASIRRSYRSRTHTQVYTYEIYKHFYL